MASTLLPFRRCDAIADFPSISDFLNLAVKPGYASCEFTTLGVGLKDGHVQCTLALTRGGVRYSASANALVDGESYKLALTKLRDGGVI